VGIGGLAVVDVGRTGIGVNEVVLYGCPAGKDACIPHFVARYPSTFLRSRSDSIVL